MRGRVFRVAVWALIVGVAAAGLLVAAQTPPSNVPLIGKTAPPELILLYTGNVVGYIEPCG